MTIRQEELHQLSAALLGSREGLDAILARISDGVTVQDRQGRLVYANPAALPMLGVGSLEELASLDQDELLSRFELMDENGDPFPIADLPGRRILLGLEATPQVVRYRVRRTGAEHFSRVAAQPLSGARGEADYVVSTFHDISDMKRSEQTLSFLLEAGNLLSASLDYEDTLQLVARLAVPTLADYCIVDITDEVGEPRRIAVHHRDQEMLGVAEELQRRFPPERDAPYGVHHVLRTGVAEFMAEISDEQLERSAEQPGRGPEYLALLRRLDLQSYLIAPMVGRERIVGALTLVYAESGRHYTESDLPVAELLSRRAASAVENAELYEAAAAGVRTRDSFLAMATHELLTPVTVVRGYAQSLGRLIEQRRSEPPPHGVGVISVEADRLALASQRLDTATIRLQRLVNDLLGISRIQHGRLELTLERVDLTEMLRSLAESVRIQQSEGRYSTDIRLELELPAVRVIGDWDPLRLEQVFLNLVDNALKYSPPDGSVRVWMQLEGDAARIVIEDEGVGIPDDQLEVIFEPLSRGSNVWHSGFPGFGMGLAVCREIVERHGGSIRAESAGPGRGARFTVRLPVAHWTGPG